LERYLARASEHKLDESVFFTGYLTHDELRYLLPCADIAVFPSKVVEAGPMVALEALSSGVFIMGTYFGGMAQITDSIKDYLPTEVIDLMKLKDDDRTMVDNISLNAIEALKIDVSGRFCTDKDDIEDRGDPVPLIKNNSYPGYPIGSSRMHG
jgi:glycosyltransferase involved in cell wall biosynthesis